MARVGIDVRKWDDFGIGIYIQNLLAGLEKSDSENSYVLFHHANQETSEFPIKMETAVESSGLYSLSEPFSLGKNARRQKLDIMHCPHYVTPFRTGCKIAVTIHDIIHLLYPEYLPGGAARLYAQYFLKRAVTKADVIFTVSECSKRDILTHLPAREEDVIVTYNSVSPLFFRSVSEEEKVSFCQKHSIQKPFVLYVGNNKPHKNLNIAIDAFKLFRHSAGKEWSFVLAGSSFKDPTVAALMLSKVEESGLSDAVKFLGFLKQQELAILYACADIFIFPSKYEGFGLPPLEAMASGVPVVASNCSSLPEILGNDALLCNPDNHVDFSSAMIRIVEDTQLRKKMKESGITRAKSFDADEQIQKTLHGYKKALGTE